MTCSQILIIEDEPDLRDTLKDLLEVYGFRVSTAGNGAEGLRRLREDGTPCMILLDLMMPVMTGWEFLETLKSEHRQILDVTPVTVLSAAADVSGVEQEYGCRVLRKPVDIKQLVTLAKESCESARPHVVR